MNPSALFKIHPVLVALCTLLLAATGCSDYTAEELFSRGKYTRSLPLFVERAEQGDADAANYVGTHYYSGLGVEKDYAAAREWLLKAALAGHAGAQRQVGILYMRGYGVEEDKPQAYGWFFHAHQNGDPRAFDYLKHVSDFITPNMSVMGRDRVTDILRGKESAS